MNEDLILTALRKIQEDLVALKAEMTAVKADTVETNDRLSAVGRGLDAVAYRLSNVEGLLVENRRELRAVTSVMKPPTP